MACESMSQCTQGRNDSSVRRRSSGWAAGCQPSTKIRTSLFGNSLTRPSTRSFVTDVVDAGDVCKNPNIQTLHGVFLRGAVQPRTLYPHFAWTKTSTYSDILVTPLEQFYRQVGTDFAWADKKVNKLVWRGANTGSAWDKWTKWRNQQRARLVMRQCLVTQAQSTSAQSQFSSRQRERSRC